MQDKAVSVTGSKTPHGPGQALWHFQPFPLGSFVGSFLIKVGQDPTCTCSSGSQPVLVPQRPSCSPCLHPILPTERLGADLGAPSEDLDTGWGKAPPGRVCATWAQAVALSQEGSEALGTQMSFLPCRWPQSLPRGFLRQHKFLWAGIALVPGDLSSILEQELLLLYPTNPSGHITAALLPSAHCG